MDNSRGLHNSYSGPRAVWLVILVLVLAAIELVPGLKLHAGLVFFGSLFTLFTLGLIYRSVTVTAEELVERGQYKLAEQRLRNGLGAHKRLGPLGADYVTDLILLARVCRETGQLDDAELFARQALEVLQRAEQEWEQWEWLNNRPMKSKEANLHALKEFQKRYMSLEPDALIELAATQYEFGRFEDSERSLINAVRKLDAYISELRNPSGQIEVSDSNWLTKNLVLTSMQSENKQKEGTRLLQALQAANQSERLLAKIYARLGCPDEEQGALSKAARRCNERIDLIGSRIALKSDNPQDFVLRAIGYLELHEYDKAIADLDRALELNPPKSLRYTVFTVRGECFNRKGKLDLTLQDFNRSLELYPVSGDQLMKRADVYDKLGRCDLAAIDRQKATRFSYQQELD